MNSQNKLYSSPQVYRLKLGANLNLLARLSLFASDDEYLLEDIEDMGEL